MAVSGRALTPLCIIAGALLVLAYLTLRSAGAVRRRGRWLAALVPGTLALLLFASAALAATAAIGVRGYRELTYEEVAATVSTEPLGPQRFRATIRLPAGRLAMYDFAGDAFYVDAHVLKWHPWLNLLGVHTAYKLDRVAGRYDAVADERGRPHTVYTLARAKPLDLFDVARRFKVLGPLVDAEYGSGSFVPAKEQATYEVRVSTSGLLIRRKVP